MLVDADLAVLGSDPAAYQAYVTGVRREYGHVDESAWRVGRGAVLRGLVERAPLYATAAGRRRWEARARANVAAELATLPDRRPVPVGTVGRVVDRRLASVQLDLVTLLVDDQDVAIDFFVGVLGFDLTTDEPATTNDGRPKRWVEVRPPGAQTGLLLAVADGDEQVAAIGRHAGGRIGLFLRVDDFESMRRRMEAAGVQFLGSPRAPSRTARWWCSSTWPATSGTSSAPILELVDWSPWLRPVSPRRRSPCADAPGTDPSGSGARRGARGGRRAR